ncbi:hypothetical protein JHL17_13195 [Azospirillum sp. YIM B02556]|uniref:Uncharacterized protein n=1 Tax=Azospirillum endophyticum TaxID=2800326 RepID=A0ABS1F4L3_9PROT|nr:hypothetical protein [Azospirillum endophyticum]MBK1838371.1 hypothetical protein [Azospirillum endophyticum]
MTPRLVGGDCPLDAVNADIHAELRTRPYDLVAVASGWHRRTRPYLAPVLRAVRPTGPALPVLGPSDQLLLATIAYPSSYPSAIWSVCSAAPSMQMPSAACAVGQGWWGRGRAARVRVPH